MHHPGSRSYPVPMHSHRPEAPSLNLFHSLPHSSRKKLQHWQQGVSHSEIVLEEWSYWLEGAKVPFLVWTDHHNLVCIHPAKKTELVTSWSLFFNRYFTLSYRPSSHHAKANPLSCQFPENPDEKSEPTTIVPASYFIVSVRD